MGYLTPVGGETGPLWGQIYKREYKGDHRTAFLGKQISFVANLPNLTEWKVVFAFESY